MKRTLTALLLCAAVLLSLSGCSTLAALEKQTATPTPEPTQTATPTPAPTAEPVPTAEPTAVPEATPAGTVELTQENYKTFLLPTPGYSLLGTAYFKAPEEIGGFVDAVVPLGAQEHPLEGEAVRSAASGLSVFVTMETVDAGEDAREALDEVTDDYLDTLEVDDDEVELLEVQYEADYDIALRPMYYTTPNGAMRFGILYTDTRGDGLYLGAAILYMPEQEDENTAALLTELSDAYGMTLPSMD